MLKAGDIAIVSGARTPFGRYCGKLKDFTAQELAAIAGKGAIERAGIDAKEFDHVVFGNAQQTSGDALYGARHVGLRAGIPIETPALTVNRLCGSGMQAIVSAAQMIQTDEAKIVLAGGMEAMSQAPFVIRDFQQWVMFYGGWEEICTAFSDDGHAAEHSHDNSGQHVRRLLRDDHVYHCRQFHAPRSGDIHALYGAEECRISKRFPRYWRFLVFSVQ